MIIQLQDIQFPKMYRISILELREKHYLRKRYAYLAHERYWLGNSRFRWNCRTWKYTTRTSETCWTRRRVSWNSEKTRPGIGTSKWPDWQKSWWSPWTKWWDCCTRAIGSGRWSRRARTGRLPGVTRCSAWRCAKRPEQRRPCARAGCSWSTWPAPSERATRRYVRFVKFEAFPRVSKFQSGCRHYAISVGGRELPTKKNENANWKNFHLSFG